MVHGTVPDIPQRSAALYAIMSKLILSRDYGKPT